MKVVATVALSNFPYWKMCMQKLREQVDEIYVRVDATKENKYEELMDSKLADYVMTNDNRVIPELNGKPYPSLAHCSGFRWMEGLTYFPYCGLAMPTNYANIPDIRFHAKTKIEHYCMYDRELEEEKKKWVLKEYGCF